MSVPVHATNLSFYRHVKGNAKKCCFVVKRFAVRKAKIRPYAVRTIRIFSSTRYARGRGWLSSKVVREKYYFMKRTYLY